MVSAANLSHTNTVKSAVSTAEYIWLDGAKPTQQLRSKTKIHPFFGSERAELKNFEEWGFDGSSTFQATGGDSDLLLKPVSFVTNPLRGEGHYLVMCEVFTPANQPHSTNSRAALRATLDQGASVHKPWFGFEQEYTMFRDGRPLGFPATGMPAPQGPYYCSVGASVAFGREIAEEHMQTCIQADLAFYGINAEVMPGQWEFQIGYRGFADESADPLTMADHLWFGRYLLQAIAEKYGVTVSFDVKPMKGDWNGAGMHTNFSTEKTRDAATGMGTIEKAVMALGERHKEHIAVYGAGNSERLTGHHETCDINTFKVGTADRGCSIRIPRNVATKGYGYFEDRRPGANANPYDVANALLRTVCGIN